MMNSTAPSIFVRVWLYFDMLHLQLEVPNYVNMYFCLCYVCFIELFKNLIHLNDWFLKHSIFIAWNKDPTKGFDDPEKAKTGENGKDEKEVKNKSKTLKDKKHKKEHKKKKNKKERNKTSKRSEEKENSVEKKKKKDKRKKKKKND